MTCLLTESTIKSLDVANVLFQLLHGFMVLQQCLGFYQGDAGFKNALVKRIPKGGYWEYVVDKKKYYVPNRGYVVVVSDYGNAYIKDFPKADFESDYLPHQIDTDKEPWLLIDQMVDFSTTLHDKPFLTKLYTVVSENVMYRKYKNSYGVAKTKPVTTNSILDLLFSGTYSTVPKRGNLIDTFKIEPKTLLQRWL